METGLVVRRAEPLARPAEPSDQNPAHVYLAGLASGSRRTMANALTLVAEIVTGEASASIAVPIGGEHVRISSAAYTLPWGAMRYQHVQAVRAALLERKPKSGDGEHYSPAMANKVLTALRSVLKEAWRLGQMPAEDFHRAVDVKPVRGERLQCGRFVAVEEQKRLFAVCARDASPAGRRDAALFALGFGAGLRRSEYVGLDLTDFDPQTGELRIIGGKGNKDRRTYLANGSLRAVCDWLKVRGDAPGPLLTPIRKGGAIEYRSMTDQSVVWICQRRADEAGVLRFAVHDFRRSFASRWLGDGLDAFVLQSLLGHSSVTTTQKYDRRPEEARAQAAQDFSVPYVLPTKKAA